MTNALLGIVAIAFLWFVLPALLALGALACCLVANALPGRRRTPASRVAPVAVDVHGTPAAHPCTVRIAVRPDHCTARAA